MPDDLNWQRAGQGIGPGDTVLRGAPCAASGSTAVRPPQATRRLQDEIDESMDGIVHALSRGADILAAARADELAAYLRARHIQVTGTQILKSAALRLPDVIDFRSTARPSGGQRPPN
ncbi:hypothetical protein [Rhizobium halophytocola]|uniref:ANTAR domain-containing protein n=1 Tax=Rhizobium halophytocola TaxID=735519 RepID=A0ABS4DW67_9HYPH|nr:hypothetical protein [Rhizobium halophytocola]MBP1849936.1 hypothetical protein [Rhizobium halophytocola]